MQFKPVFFNRRSTDRQRSASTFLPVRQVNSSIIPQFKIVLFIVTHLTTRAQYFFHQPRDKFMQYQRISTADSLSFAFLKKTTPALKKT